MSAGRWRCNRSLIRRITREVVLALGCAALSTACGGGISLDPGAWDPPEKVDAADVFDGGHVDVSLDLGGAQDAAEERDISSASPDVSGDLDVSTPPADMSLDARSDGSEATQPDVGLDAFDEFDVHDVLPDSHDASQDLHDGAADVAFDAFPEAGDGCTLACGWPDADYYVDARAASDGKGSKLEPFKTITRAIAAYAEAPGQPKIVYVAAGTYDRALGEQFPLILRGLSLKGAGRDATLIMGTGIFDHSAQGGPFSGRYLVTIVAGDAALKTALSDIAVRSESPVPVENYYGVFCDRGSATGEIPPPAGQTELARVSVGPGYHGSVVATTSTSTVDGVTGCNIVIRSSLLTGGWAGLRAHGCEQMMLAGPVLVEMGGPDPASGNVVSWMQAPGDGAAGARLEGCVLRASFQNNAFVDSVYGVTIDDKGVPFGTPGRRPLTIKHNSFERLAAGGVVAAGNSVEIVELSDNRFVGITRAVGKVPGPRAIALSIDLLRLGKVRRNQFIGNDFGMLLAVPVAPGQAADFGTADDPGGNVFRCNSSPDEPGADLGFMGVVSSDPNWGGTIHLAGNAWDHTPPTVRTDDPIPNGCDISTIRVPHVTLDVQNSSLATGICPVDRVPGQ
jgi:hypothetical protein